MLPCFYGSVFVPACALCKQLGAAYKMLSLAILYIKAGLAYHVPVQACTCISSIVTAYVL